MLFYSIASVFSILCREYLSPAAHRKGSCHSSSCLWLILNSLSIAVCMLLHFYNWEYWDFWTIIAWIMIIIVRRRCCFVNLFSHLFVTKVAFSHDFGGGGGVGAVSGPSYDNDTCLWSVQFRWNLKLTSFVGSTIKLLSFAWNTAVM